MHRVLHGRSKEYGRNIKTRCIGLTSNLLKRKDWSFIKQDRTQSSFTTRSQLIVSRRLSWWDLEKSYTTKYMRLLDLLWRFPWNMTEWKNWVQKLLEVVKTPNKPNQRTKNNNCKNRETCLAEQPSGSVNRTPSHVTFSGVSPHSFQCRTWHWLKMFVRITSSMLHAQWLFWFSSTLHFALFTVSLIFLFILLIFIFIFIFHVGWFGEKYTVRFREWEVRHFGRQQPSHKLWA